MGLDLTLIRLFLVSHFNFFLFIPFSDYPSAFYRTLNTYYRIVFNGKFYCCDGTFTDVLFTLLLAKNI